jgi:hypothetical protein
MGRNTYFWHLPSCPGFIIAVVRSDSGPALDQRLLQRLAIMRDGTSDGLVGSL